VANSAHLEGKYRLIFEGQGNPSVKGGNATISNIQYNSSSNTTTADITVPTATKFYLYLRLLSVGSGGVRKIRLMRPIYPGATQSYDESVVFTQTILNTMSRFNLVRYMDLLGSNSDTYHINTDWNTRTRPNYATQSVAWNIQNYQANNPATNKAWYKYQGKGVAWEYLILLANASNTDVWINIPHAADDDYITKIAQAFKYGTDGVNPYTTTQINPVFPPLNPNLKLYVEYSNEVWNTGFPVYGYLGNKVIQEPSNSDIRYDGNTTDRFLRYRWAARRSLQISNAFRAVFGNGQMMDRIRPLYEWQKGQNNADLGNANRTGTVALGYIEEVYGDVHPVDYYFYGGGCSGYYQASTPSQGADLDNIWTLGEFAPEAWSIPKQEWSVYITSAYGLKRAIYEGGPSFGDQNGAGGISELAPEALLDSRIKNEIVEHQHAYGQVGGELFTYFVLGGDERWGFMQGHLDTLSYKLQGIDSIRNQARPDINLGYQVDGSNSVLIPGRRWKLTNKDNGGWNPNNISEADSLMFINEGAWYSYHFNTDRNKTYQVRIHYSSDSSGVMDVYLGAQKVGTTAINSTNGDTLLTSNFTFRGDKDNVQAIRVKAASGHFSVVFVEIGENLTQNSINQPSPVEIKRNPPTKQGLKFSFFPNPVNTQSLNLVINDLIQTEAFNVLIADTQGRIVFKHQLKDLHLGENQISLSIPRLNPGIYFISCQGYSQKLIVSANMDH
jgi:Secretion system C-terminal sorting domain/delta endotoxin